MTRTLGLIIADSLKLSLSYAERLRKDIPDDRFARFALGRDGLVESNHAAFVFGHLSLYPARILKELGKAPQPAPENFMSVFSKDAKCVDDPEGKIYPGAEAITSYFFGGYRAVLEVLPEVSNEILEQPNPLGGPMAEKFPTMGSMHNFYVGGHMMLHLGQLSAWRRMFAMPPA
ncbi:MAG: hypothetical protein KDA81_18405 [Planctomycetaceae bacterium]|nr:hypothetical protein [Planctomycetaceae bacterium]